MTKATQPDAPDFLAAGGELGAMMRAYDWTATPLGPPQDWPRSLKTALRILLTSRQPMWLGWGEDLITFYNDAYRSIIGGKHPAALGKPTREVWREIWHEIGPRIATAIGGVEGTYDEEQLLIMERNGYPEETYYTFSYSPIPDDDGRPAGIFCANTDDTGRVIGQRRMALLGDLAADALEARTAQDAAARAAASLALAARDFPFALIYLADPEDGVLRLSGSAGLKGGHPAAPFSLPPHAEAPWPAGFALGARRIQWVDGLGERFGALPKGPWTAAPERAAVLPIPGSAEGGGQSLLIVGLSPMRPVDEDGRSFLELLAGQIATGIANGDAYEAERRRAESLAELDRAKTAFFSNVSHEFRTPLTLMLGPIEDLAAQTQDKAQQALVRTALRNGQRLLKLVNALLDFSRIEAGRVQARFEPTDLAAYTADLVSSFRSAMDRAGLTLNVEAPPLAEPVYLDRDMWEKVVLNLMSNAFKFTFEGEVAVKVWADGEGAKVEVSDTGVGIPAAELPHLFERFHRVEGSRGRSIEGSGIGLALVNELVKLHGGRVEVQSRPEIGTSFTVALPFGSAHLPYDQVRTAAPEPAATAPRALGYLNEAMRWLPGSEISAEPETGLDEGATSLPLPPGSRVLVADDNADMRDYVARLLKGRGFEVRAVSDGREALAAARAQAPDLILSDVMMPELDGFGLLTALRADPGLQDIPVILLSARAGEEARVEGLSAGADDYLVKPFSARELLARIAAAVQLAGMRREARDAIAEEARALELLNQMGASVAGELNLDRAVQAVTDAATELTGAAFGSFFYNVLDGQGGSYLLYSLSGVDRAAFDKFPMPRNTQVFGPTFAGEAIVRSADITKDPRYGHNAPHHGQPKGHLPVRSYLAAPVLSRSGEVLGGLFFGHPEVGVFTDRSERLLTGIAAQAAIAIDNARLYQAAQIEIARRTASEAALRESEEQLERKVEERTAALAAANQELVGQIEERERVEATLRQMQRLEAVGQLTSGVAHDFNNLLTVVIGVIDGLERGEQDERRLRRLGMAREAAQRGAKLTAQLLAFSRRQRLEPKGLNLNDTVEGMHELLRSTLGGQVRLKVEMGEGLWPALVDPTQIELVILNLAINARDAMPVGGALVIETANVQLSRKPRRPEEPDPGDYVCISVRDNGEGMTPEVAAKAFEPFFTTKAVGKGSGLGLAQVYGFAKQSGGGVALETAVGQGACVQVFLPRATNRAPDEPIADIQPMARAPARVILLVDDDAAVREVEAECLRTAGYQVVEASSGAAALQALQTRTDIEGAVVDFAMPDMNGAEVAQQAEILRPGLPILFVTGFGDLNLLGEVGEARIVQKPFHPDELARRMERLFADEIAG